MAGRKRQMTRYIGCRISVTCSDGRVIAEICATYHTIYLQASNVQAKKEGNNFTKSTINTHQTIGGDSLFDTQAERNLKARSTMQRTNQAKAGHKWIVDANGTITNFSLKLLRQDIVSRLQSGSTLYTLEECRMLIVEMARVATRWQEEDFANLLYLNELHQKVLPGRVANYQWPIVVTPIVPFSKPCDASQDSVLYRVNKVVEELNRSLIRMVDKLCNDRRERLLLGARMLRDIESVVSKEAGDST